MGEQDPFYVLTLTILTLMGTVLTVAFWPVLPADWQAYLCESNRCTAMDWLAATAGWVGFVAALIAAYLVFGQLKEQRRQTSFLLGDGNPEVEFIQTSGKATSCIFSLINYNRRGMALVAVRVISPFDHVPVNEIYRADSEDEAAFTRVRRDGGVERRGRIAGWLDRSKAPHNADFYLGFDDDDFEWPDYTGITGETTLEIDYAYPDALKKTFTLTVTAPAAMVTPNPLSRYP